MSRDAVVSRDDPGGEVEPLQARALSASLSVRDLPRSCAWYCDALGFTVDQEHRREGTLFAVSLRAGEVRILLTQDDGARGLERAKGEGFSLMLTTTQNIDQIAERIRAFGSSLDTEPVDTPWGARVFRVRDPDGFKYAISSQT